MCREYAFESLRGQFPYVALNLAALRLIFYIHPWLSSPAKRKLFPASYWYTLKARC